MPALAAVTLALRPETVRVYAHAEKNASAANLVALALSPRRPSRRTSIIRFMDSLPQNRSDSLPPNSLRHHEHKTLVSVPVCSRQRKNKQGIPRANGSFALAATRGSTERAIGDSACPHRHSASCSTRRARVDLAMLMDDPLGLQRFVTLLSKPCGCECNL